MAQKVKSKVLAKFSFKPVKIQKGYASRVLLVDISKNKIETKPVSQDMKDKFTGGKGFDLKLLWDSVNESTKWDSPENTICIASGPLGGTTSFPGAGKSIVTTISPLTGSVMDCNVGGYFGPLFKFCGFDAICVNGKSNKDVIVFINGVENEVTIEESPITDVNSHIVAEKLTKMFADDELDKQNLSVVSAGVGADHTLIGCLNFSFYDLKRKVARLKQAGRGGIGTVLRNKKITALVVKTKNSKPKWRIEFNN